MPYTPPAGNAIDFDLETPYTPPAGNAIDFDLKEEEGDVLTSFFDGKIRIKDETTNLFDGKLYLFKTSTNLFDGKLGIFTYSTDLFDGKLTVKNSTFDLFDGKLRIKTFSSDLFDGRVDIGQFLTSLFDGKLRIENITFNLFDGKLHVLKSSTDLFDGKLRVTTTSTDLFDSILRIKDTITKFFDGRIRIWDETTNLFDGRLHLFKLSSSLFDGKATITSPGAEHDFFDGKIQLKDITFNLFDGKINVHSGLMSVWSYGGDLSVIKDYMAGAGTQSAGLCIGGNPSTNYTEEYNGATWSLGGNLAAAKMQAGACGTQLAALNFAGSEAGVGDSITTEEYNGTAWSSGGDLPVKRRMCAGAGLQAAGLCIGGNFDGTIENDTSEYNGTVWSSGGDLLLARDLLAAAGTQTAGLSICGRNTSYQAVVNTEEYNGTSWLIGGNSGVARYTLCGCGTQSAALNFAGNVSGTTTETYNGTSWASAASLNTSRARPGGCGTQPAGLCFGGCCTYKTSEEYGPQGSSDQFDGKLYLFKKYTPLFDGKLTVNPPGIDVFCGRLHIHKITSNLFDGKIELELKKVWLLTADLTYNRAYMGSAGSQTAALSFFGNVGTTSFASAHEYNGVSWSSAANGYARSRLGSCGTQSAALGFGGVGVVIVKETYEYNGTSWSLGGDLSVAEENLAGAGTQTAGLSFGSNGYGTEEYNGTTWSAGGDLQAYKFYAAGSGLQTAALAFNDVDTEEYNGTSWSIGGDLNVPRYFLAGDGTQAATLSFGGYYSGYKTTTEEYDGTSWTVVNSLNIARRGLGGCGTTSAALSFGGYDGFTINTAEEYGSVGYNIFDGKVQIKDEITNLFDGKLIISTTSVDLFDGKLYIGNFSTNLFDGKLRLGLIRRESLLGSFGEPYKIDIRNAFGLPFKIDINSPLGSSEIRNILIGLGETIEYLLYIPMAQIGTQQIINHLSDYIIALQSLINDLSVGIPFSGKQSLLTSVQSEASILSLRNQLSGIITGLQNITTGLTDGFSSRISLIHALALKNDIHSVLTLLGSLSDQAASYPECTMNVYLNGVPINNQIISLKLTMSRETTFDVLSFNSTDANLYTKLQEVVSSEDSVVEVQYKGDSWAFLIEEISGYELSFSFWGRSIAAAKSDAPFKDSSNFELGEDTLASVVASDLVPDLSVAWNTVDWKVPAGWSVDGTPVQMLKTLASGVGAVVRVYPDGTGFYVDEKYTTRPVDLPYAEATEVYDRDSDLMTLEVSSSPGTGSNAVTVYGYSPLSKYSIMLEAESCVDVGNPAKIKVYPALGGVGYELKASEGAPTYQHSETEEHTETIIFIGGKGSVAYPIIDLKSITWDGIAPAGFEYTAGQNEIILTDETVAAVGKVIYSTKYDLWFAEHAKEGKLAVVYFLEEGGGIVARVYFGDGDREAEDINRPLLTSIEAATAAGMAHLDDTSYTKRLRKITVPCSGVFDGEVISIQSDISNVTGNVFVLSHDISARIENKTLKICSGIDVVQFEV